MVYGTVRSLHGDELDRCLAVLFRGPRSFTGEDVAEFHLHGGMALSTLVLEACLVSGARLARPGEFTQRAFLNGRLDLAQAEAVQQLIASRSEEAARLAARNLSGALSRQVDNIRGALLDWLARLEAEIDFGDEVPSFDAEESRRRLSSAQQQVSELLNSARLGRARADGVKTVLIGPPNAGKSTLLNLLLGSERALVTPIPGTTRDTIEEVASLGGLYFQLVDTAGIRSATDLVEQLGIERSRQEALSAELLIVVLDGSSELPDEPTLWELCASRRCLVLLNKSDLGLAVSVSDVPVPGVRVEPVSLLEGGSRERLVRLIASYAREITGDKDEVYTLTERQLEALTRCQESLLLLGSSLEAEQSAEFLALDLRQAVQALGEVQGIDVTEEILDRIFSTFCLGK